MARRFSRKKGKSGSTKPVENTPKPWQSYKKEEVEQLVIKLAKSDTPQAKIGLILRDSYGIPDVRNVTDKKISKILEENKLKPKLPEDLTNLIKRELELHKHLETNKQDKSARRGLILTDSKIRGLIKYYKKSGIISKDWKYNKESIKITI